MPIDHTKPIIELDKISFSYGNDVVLKDISFSVHKGDYLGIIGPNGGGKTTLLRIILGLLKPTLGQIKLFGQDINMFNSWNKFGYVPQKLVTFETHFPATVEEVVLMGRYGKLGLFRLPKKHDYEMVTQALEKAGMIDFRKRLIGDLSGGQQQRVFIARALAGEPEVIILDEPTTGVDLQSRERFYSLLEDLHKKLNLTLILVSHDIETIMHKTTEVAFINRSLIAYGPTAQMINISNKFHEHGAHIGH